MITCVEIEKSAKEHGVDLQYDAVEADKVLAEPVPEGYVRWRCKLCGYPQGDFLASQTDVGVYGCGGCGQHCVRPIAEFEPNLEVIDAAQFEPKQIHS